jgi:hypothetical protein
MALATACCIFSWVVTGGKPLTQVDELFQARHVVLQDSRISAARTHCTDCERVTLGGAGLHWTAVQTRATPDELETDKSAKRSPKLLRSLALDRVRRRAISAYVCKSASH